MITSVIAAVLWLHCSLIYLGAFIFEYQEEANSAPREDEEDDGSDSWDTEALVTNWLHPLMLGSTQIWA